MPRLRSDHLLLGFALGSSRFIRDPDIRAAFERLELAGQLHFLHISQVGSVSRYVFRYREEMGLGLPVTGWQVLSMPEAIVRAEFLL